MDIERIVTKNKGIKIDDTLHLPMSSFDGFMSDLQDLENPVKINGPCVRVFENHVKVTVFRKEAFYFDFQGKDIHLRNKAVYDGENKVEIDTYFGGYVIDDCHIGDFVTVDDGVATITPRIGSPFNTKAGCYGIVVSL
jgi:hypothetical protein